MSQIGVTPTVIPRHGVGRLAPAWQPGQSGNPLGPRVPMVALARHIREQTGAGRELSTFYLAILRGEPIRSAGTKRTVRPTLDHRLAAAQWLSDRGWGRAKEILELAGESSSAERLALLGELSDDERETVRRILTSALERLEARGPAFQAAIRDCAPESTIGRSSDGRDDAPESTSLAGEASVRDAPQSTIEFDLDTDA